MNDYRPKAVAITGATGQLGRAWLREMARRHPDVQLRLLVRSEARSCRDPEFAGLLRRFRGDVSFVEGDLTALRLNAKQVNALTTADGGLWHFAANTDLSGPANQPATNSLRAVNRDGTAALLRLCEGNGQAPFYHASSAYVAGLRTGRVMETDLDLTGAFRNGYERSKAEAEHAVREAFARGMRGAIFRPSLVLENDGASKRSLAQLFANAVASSMRRGGSKLTLRHPPTSAMNMVSEHFVIATMLEIAARPVVGRTFHLTAKASMRMSDIGEILSAHVPGFRLAFAPERSAPELDGPSILLDRVLHELRSYCTTEVTFDRTHTEAALGDRLPPEIDWHAVVERRLADVGLGQCVA